MNIYNNYKYFYMNYNKLSIEIYNYIKLKYNIIINLKKIYEILNYNKIKKLKLLLNKNKINHKTNIIKENSLKDAHIYCKLNNISGNIYGFLIEYYIINKYNMIKNNSILCNGDVKYKNINLEIKSSLGGINNNKFNYVQIRLNHNCNYILTAYHLHSNNLYKCGKLFIFYLNKLQLKNIIIKYGNYAHGTILKNGIINEDNFNYDKEYSIRPKYKDKCWNELLNYKINNIKKLKL